MDKYEIVADGQIMLFNKNVFIHDYELNIDNFFMLPQHTIETFEMQRIQNMYLCRFAYKDITKYSNVPVSDVECVELKSSGIENAKPYLRNQAGFIFVPSHSYSMILLYSTCSTNTEYLPAKELVNTIDEFYMEFVPQISFKLEQMLKERQKIVFLYSFYDPALLTAANIWFEDFCPRINYNPAKNKLIGAVLSKDATAQYLGIRSFGITSSIWTRDYDLPVIDKSLVFSLVSDIRSIIENDLER